MNKRAFSQDSSYCLLCSLEKMDEEGNFKGKADMFHKRTIKRAEAVTSWKRRKFMQRTIRNTQLTCRP